MAKRVPSWMVPSQTVTLGRRCKQCDHPGGFEHNGNYYCLSHLLEARDDTEMVVGELDTCRHIGATYVEGFDMIICAECEVYREVPAWWRPTSGGVADV